jgi:hypothetical protein
VFESGSLEYKKGNNGLHNWRENSALVSGYALLRTQESSIHDIRNTVQLIIEELPALDFAVEFIITDTAPCTSLPCKFSTSSIARSDSGTESLHNVFTSLIKSSCILDNNLATCFALLVFTKHPG